MSSERTSEDVVPFNVTPISLRKEQSPHDPKHYTRLRGIVMGKQVVFS
jgi:hypothetical protein